MRSLDRKPIVAGFKLQLQFRIHHTNAHPKHGRALRVLQQQHLGQDVGYIDALPVPLSG